jgi:hypothetical protein
MLKEFIEKIVREQPRTFAFTLSRIKQPWFVDAVIQETSYLSSNATFSQRIWHLINGSEIPFCEICGKMIETFHSYSRGYHKHCGTKCRHKARWKSISQEERLAINKKKEKTCIEKFGTPHSFSSESVKEKIKESMIKNWGVENPGQSKEIQKRVQDSIEKTYGVRNPGQTENAKQGRINALGVENPFNSEKIQKKISQTFLDKYGVNHPFQDSQIFDKAIKFRTKEYMSISGKKYFVQGYENIVLEILLKKYGEENFIYSRGEMSNYFKCFYEFKGKRRYYPDFFVPSENLVIEVKSAFTLKRELEKNRVKMKAIKEMGMKMEIWICSKTELLEKLSEI